MHGRCDLLDVIEACPHLSVKLYLYLTQFLKIEELYGKCAGMFSLCHSSAKTCLLLPSSQNGSFVCRAGYHSQMFNAATDRLAEQTKTMIPSLGVT